MSKNIDDSIKEIKEQRFYGYGPNHHFKICNRCGNTFYSFLSESEELANEAAFNGDDTPSFCDSCILKIVENRKTFPVKQKKIKKNICCNYCFKKRRLVGKWCRTCRNSYQASEIRKLLSVKSLTSDEKNKLDTYKNYPIWNRKFSKVRL